MAEPRDSIGHPLHGARLKADFAVTRLDSLNADVAAFLTANRPEIETLAHNDRLGADFKIRLTATPPDEWALRIGEIVHHLRSALDHVAWQLATAPNKQTAFPRVNTANQFYREAAALSFSADIMRRFEAIRSADVLEPPVNPLIHARGSLEPGQTSPSAADAAGGEGIGRQTSGAQRHDRTL